MQKQKKIWFQKGTPFQLY